MVVSSMHRTFILSGILPNTVHLSNEVANAIALIGGAMAGAISSPDRIFIWKGLVIGMVYTLGATVGGNFLQAVSNLNFQI